MTDTFRKNYTPLSEDTKLFVLEIKNIAEQLENLFNTVSNREMSLAKTDLERAIMWATKAIILDSEK